jgi:hypothetical protein
MLEKKDYESLNGSREGQVLTVGKKEEPIKVAVEVRKRPTA